MLRQQIRELVATWLASAMASRTAPDGARWNQSSLAEASGVSRETIWKILKARADAEDDTLQALARAVGVDLPTVVASDATLTIPGGPVAGSAEAARDPEAFAAGWRAAIEKMRAAIDGMSTPPRPLVRLAIRPDVDEAAGAAAAAEDEQLAGEGSERPPKKRRSGGQGQTGPGGPDK